MNTWMIEKNSVRKKRKKIFTSPPEKEDFYSHLNMEDINDVDYTHAK